MTENGTLTETPGLLLFVAQRFPGAELAPLSDPFALAQVQEFNSYLCSTVHVAHAHIACGLYFAREYEGVIEAAKRLIRSYPDFPMIYRWPAAALGKLGRAAKAK